MKKVQVPAVYIAYDKIKTPEEEKRALRLLEKFDAETQVWVKEKEIFELMKSKGWYEKGRKTGERKNNNPNIILTTFDWQDVRNNLKARSNYAFTPGKFASADFRDKKQLREFRGAVCNSGWEIHTAFGCLHSCTYCHIGEALTIMLDIETFTDNLKVLMDDNKWQKLYKYDNQTDILTLEPEYGASKSLVEFFASTNNYLMLYTKSDNVDHLLNLDHNGQTKVCWTMSCKEVAEKYELGAATLEERAEAAEKCQDAEYGIRFRFSPIIPVKGWKEKNAEMIDRLFRKLKPEVISLEMLCHMNEKQSRELFPDLEYEFSNNITEYELFPHQARSEIYRFFIDEIRKHDKKVKVALCLETERMWNELRHKINGTPDNFYCCCGAKCI